LKEEKWSALDWEPAMGETWSSEKWKVLDWEPAMDETWS
jgi:hypothetical protein